MPADLVAYQGLTSVANGGFLDIRPTGTQEAVIHNLYYQDNVEVYWYDGTNAIKFDSDGGANAAGGGNMLSVQWHVSNAFWVRVKNVAASGAKLIGYDGVVSRL